MIAGAKLPFEVDRPQLIGWARTRRPALTRARRRRVRGGIILPLEQTVDSRARGRLAPDTATKAPPQLLRPPARMRPPLTNKPALQLFGHAVGSDAARANDLEALRAARLKRSTHL